MRPYTQSPFRQSPLPAQHPRSGYVYMHCELLAAVGIRRSRFRSVPDIVAENGPAGQVRTTRRSDSYLTSVSMTAFPSLFLSLVLKPNQAVDKFSQLLCRDVVERLQSKMTLRSLLDQFGRVTQLVGQGEKHRLLLWSCPGHHSLQPALFGIRSSLRRATSAVSRAHQGYSPVPTSRR